MVVTGVVQPLATFPQISKLHFNRKPAIYAY